MVTANTAPLPRGFLPTDCQCQYMQWGYWTGQLDQVNANNQITRFDRAHINFWMAGQPTSPCRQRGPAPITGPRSGRSSITVRVNPRRAIFATSYNFGNNTGTIGISNFDGRAVNGTVFGAKRHLRRGVERNQP